MEGFAQTQGRSGIWGQNSIDPSDLGLVSVVIPVYNEEEAIGHDLDVITKAMDISGIYYEVIVVDDGSGDRTSQIVESRKEVKLVRHDRNLGTGAALKTGIRHAKGDIVVMTDGDGTYPNHEIPALLSYMGEYDMVIGARKRERGTVPWLRTPAKAFIRTLASYMTGVKIPDLNSGLRCFRKDVAEKFFPILPQGHSWVSTITLAFLSSGYQVKFLPIDYYERKGGKSSFHPVKDTLSYLGLVARTVMYFNPLKILGPLSLALLTIGGAKLIRDVMVYNFHVPGSTIMIVLTGIQVLALGLIADLIVKRTSRDF
ncbi:MAG: glycosyl transferase family 2 [Dehalococcoidia bacterium]|nr:glycosyl transferase family 2 [Dehalococcoidia bacterium]